MVNRYPTVQVTVQYRCIFVLLFGRYSLQLDKKEVYFFSLCSIFFLAYSQNIAKTAARRSLVILSIDCLERSSVLKNESCLMLEYHSYIQSFQVSFDKDTGDIVSFCF